MEKHVLFLRPDQRIKLNKLADEAKVSIAEIARRAIDSFQLSASHEEERALDSLLDAVINSNQTTLKALKSAHQAIQTTLSQLSTNQD